MVGTAPVRPVNRISSVTGYVPVQVHQFYSAHAAITLRNMKLAKLVISCSKTHRNGIQFAPTILKTKENSRIVFDLKTELTLNFDKSLNYDMPFYRQ